MLTGVIRASYVHVFEPQAPLGGGDPKYSITVLIPKTDVDTLNRIYAEIEKAMQDGVQKVFGGNIPPNVRIPIYDGDGLRASGEPFAEECKGHMVITASSKQRPSVVDCNVQPIINPGEFYSGCYARLTLNFFAYNQSGNKGIGCGLNNVQKIRDGEPLSGRTTAEEDFGGANAYASNANPSVQQSEQTIPPTQYQPAPYQQTQYLPAPYQQYQAAPVQMQPAQQMINPVTGQPMAEGVMGI